MMTNSKRRCGMFWGCLALSGACICAAQNDPLTIRVESGRIVVPVAWVGPVRCEYSGDSHGDACWWDREEIAASNLVVTMALLHKIDPTPFSIGLLSSNKFHLFEDGNEQPIQSLREVAPQDVEVWLDNLGAHREAAFGPRGIWSTSEEPQEVLEAANSGHFFLITYASPASPEGSCHAIRIKAPHTSRLVYSKKYCTLPQPASDPLQGTPEGARLEEYLAAGKPGSIHPLAQSSAFFEAPGKARVNVNVELPFNEVKPKDWHDGTLPSALLIEAYGKDGRVAGRLSERLPEDATFPDLASIESLKEAAAVVTPTHYNGQMDLQPGEYKLAVAYSHGKDFGLAQVPLKVHNYNGKKFTISSIALCKRVRKTGAVPAAKDFVPLIAGDYEFTPATDTVFRKGDSLIAYFELYEPALEQPQPTLHVKYTMRIRNEQTGAVALDTVEPADSWIQPGKSTIPVAVEPVLSKLNLPRGKYQFQIQATDSAGSSTPMRSVEFSIE